VEKHTAPIFRVKDGGSKFVMNLVTCLPTTLSHCRRPGF